jgi:hypothetical protein
MSWDHDLFRYLWMWQVNGHNDYPGMGEPTTALWSLSPATHRQGSSTVRNGTARLMQPEETIEMNW